MAQMPNPDIASAGNSYGHWFVSHPAPGLWPGKEMEDGPSLWDPIPTQKFLAPSFGSPQFWPAWSFGK